MGYPFGQDFTYTFYPLADNAAVSSIPSQTPTIHIFPDSAKPTRSEAAEATPTSAVQTISSWASNSNGGYDITVDAIDDPDPTGTMDKRTYWIAINFTLSSSEQTQTVVRALEMERVSGHHKRISITNANITARWPDVTAYVSTGEIDSMITDANTMIREHLRTAGYEWAQIYRPDRLYHASMFKVLDLICLSQVQQRGDKFDLLHQEYSATYKSIMSGIKTEYDADNDGEPDTATKGDAYAFVTR